MKTKTLAAIVAAVALAGLGVGIPAAANATEQCEPRDAWVEHITHDSIGDETIPNPDYQPATEGHYTTEPNPDYVPGTPDTVTSTWWNWSPNKDTGPFDGPPAFPTDPRGTWQGPHTNGGPGQDQIGTYRQGNGNGSWFHRENVVTPGTPAQGEPTIQVWHDGTPAVGEPTIPNPEYVPGWVEDVEHPAVICEPEVPVFEPRTTITCGTATFLHPAIPGATEYTLLIDGVPHEYTPGTHYYVTFSGENPRFVQWTLLVTIDGKSVRVGTTQRSLDDCKQPVQYPEKPVTKPKPKPTVEPRHAVQPKPVVQHEELAETGSNSGALTGLVPLFLGLFIVGPAILAALVIWAMRGNHKN